MQRGGDVLYLIGLLAFVMWFLIFERMWFYFFTHRNYLSLSVSEWEKRHDKSSWNSKAIRDMLISENEIRIDKNLGLIKMCVGIAPLFGLFGTITGMIEVFHVMAFTGCGYARSMAGGVSKATLPTMAGMTTALSGVFATIYLNAARNREEILIKEVIKS